MTSSLVVIASDRRCWLLLLSAALAVVLAFFAVPDEWALKLVSSAGFWFVLTAFVIWVWALWRTYQPELRAWQWRATDWPSAAIVITGSVVLLAHENFAFKIVMDEVMLLGTSMCMHLDKTVLTPLRGNDIQGAFVILEGILDKRPLFFPFLVSLLHDFTRYRPENAFILNAILTFVFLTQVFFAGRKLAGRTAGWIGVVLFAGLPLLAQNSTGGGFELLNLVMILATLLLAARFIDKRDAPSLTALCFSGLLLAQVRYESVIFLVPVAITVLWVWFRERRAILSWPVIVAPLLMIHYPLQHRIFDLRASAWEMFSKPGYTKPFSLEYVPENLVHALRFFFAGASDQPNSLILSALGVIAVPFFALLALRRVRTLPEQPAAMAATIIFALGFVLQFALMMCYFWGKFDDVVIRRLSLPTQLGMVLAVLAVLSDFARVAVPRTVLAAAAVALLARGVPSMAAHAYSQEYLPGREVAWRRQFMADQTRNDYFVIDNDSILWLTHKVSATAIGPAVRRRDALVFHMRNRTFSDVYVFQRYNVDPDTGRLSPRDGDQLPPSFVLEPVREERLQALTVSRISRLKEIREGDVTLTTPERQDHEVPKSRAEIDRARQAYLENFIRQLP